MEQNNKIFSLSIVSEEKIIFDGKAASLIVPCFRGYLGVLANHAPLVALTMPGKITVRNEMNKTYVFESKTNGFFEVKNNKVSILL